MLNICFSFKENVFVLRGVNKANNSECQGSAKDLRGQRSGREKVTLVKKKDFSHLLTKSATDSQETKTLFGGLCATYHLL